MRYLSTRGQSDALSFTEAVATGLSPDGGLYVPESFPDISQKLEEWKTNNKLVRRNKGRYVEQIQTSRIL